VGVDFYLNFPSREAAESAAETLRGEGYAVVTRPGAADEKWEAVVGREVSETELDSVVERLTQLAESLGGGYDGHDRER